jgi:hypothetical protein
MLCIKGRQTPGVDPSRREDPLEEMHSPAPPDARTHPSARLAAAMGADPTRPETATVFPNASIAQGPIGDLLPAGRRAKAREAAAASAGGSGTAGDPGAVVAGRALRTGGAGIQGTAVPGRADLAKPGAAPKRAAEDAASPVQKGG